MPQLHLYVPDEIARAVRLRAEAAGLPVSRWLAERVVEAVREEDKWPAGYLDESFEPSPDFTVPEDTPIAPLEPLDAGRS